MARGRAQSKPAASTSATAAHISRSISFRTDEQRANDTERKRRERSRPDGELCAPTRYSWKLRETMVNTGWVKPEQSNCRQAIAEAAAQILEQWRARWEVEIIFSGASRVTFDPDRRR